MSYLQFQMRSLWYRLGTFRLEYEDHEYNIKALGMRSLNPRRLLSLEN